MERVAVLRMTSVSTRNLARPVAPATLPWRRVTLYVLIACGAVALAAVAGPEWVVRVGAIVAIATGVVAAVLATRAFRALDHDHRRARGREVVEMERSHGDRLRQHRRDDAEVASTIREHLRRQGAENDHLRDRLGEAHEVIGQQQRSLTALDAERTELQRELRAKDDTITDLRTTVESQEVELSALLGDVDAAEIYTMPRRVRSAERAVAPDPSEPVDLATAQTAAQAVPPVEELRQQA